MDATVTTIPEEKATSSHGSKSCKVNLFLLSFSDLDGSHDDIDLLQEITGTDSVYPAVCMPMRMTAGGGGFTLNERITMLNRTIDTTGIRFKMRVCPGRVKTRHVKSREIYFASCFPDG